MRVSRNDLVATIVEQGGERPLTFRFMRAVEPLCRAAEAGKIELADEQMLNQANVAVAIAQATRTPVREIVPVPASTAVMRGDFATEAAYETLLSLALRRTRYDEVHAAHGERCLDRLVEGLWENLGEAYTAAMQASHGRFLDGLSMGLANDVAFGPMVVVAYAALYASRGDEKGLKEMHGLVRLLPWLVPIGAPAGHDGRWLVLVQ